METQNHDGHSAIKSENKKLFSPKTILIVEDEKHIAEGIAFNLKRQGHRTLIAPTGPLAIELWQQQRPHLIVLDLMLPQLDGHSVLEWIRQRDPWIPIFILTAKGDRSDRIHGLQKGCDEYMTKPFDLEEFLLRLERLLLTSRSLQEQSSMVIPEEIGLKQFSFGSHHIDLANLVAQTPLGKIALTVSEAKLLAYFAQYPNIVLAREKLLRHLWDGGEGGESRAIDNFIMRFRKYFEKDSKKPQYFLSARGRGYLFVPQPPSS